MNLGRFSTAFFAWEISGRKIQFPKVQNDFFLVEKTFFKKCWYVNYGGGSLRRSSIIVEGGKFVFHINIFPLPEDNEVGDCKNFPNGIKRWFLV